MKAKKLILSSALLVAIAAVIFSCKKDLAATSTSPVQYSSTPVLSDTPDNYKMSGNDNLAVLGRVLFYDKKLSLNGSVACASCHQQEKAFCDNLQFSTGLNNGKTSRNAPSIFAKTGKLFWDGRASSFADLALKPVQNHVEMGFDNLTDLEKRVSASSYYPDLFKKAFGDGNATVTKSKIQQALAEFLKNFNFSNNKFNRKETLTASEQLGRSLFFGKARCSGCHHIEASNGPIFDSIIIPGGGTSGYGNTDESHNIGLDNVYSDNGIGTILNDASQDGDFMIPVLLNVEYTAPYMHDGRYKTLDEVVEHYNSGIKNHPNLDIRLRDVGFDINFDNMTLAQENELIKKFDTNKNGIIESSELAGIPPVKLGLTTPEKRALVDFLKTLSDPTILTEQKFSNPFALK